MFTGGGKGVHIVGSKRPDFTNYKTKQLIELFGDYWHRGENPQNRIRLFKRLGWDCLVIWGKELKDPRRLKIRLERFCDNARA